MKNPARLILILTLTLCTHTSIQASEITHVFHISVDGVRGDLLKALVEDNPTLYSGYARLQNEGAFTYNARTDYTHTNTIPAHGTILTGRPVLQPPGLPNTIHHGYNLNSPPPTDTIHIRNPNVPYIHSTFDVAHDHGLSTGLYMSKSRLDIYTRSWNAANGAPDTIGEDNGTNKVDRFLNLHNSTSALMNTLLADVQTTPFNYTFIHLVDPDSQGHNHDWGSDIWNNSVNWTDNRIVALFNLIDNNPIYTDKTAVIVTSDHGGGVPPRSHSDPTAPENYTIPMFIWGAGLEPGSELHDHFANRFEPGNTRPDYLDPNQPLRNGDTANIAMQLLGLPNVPGSFMFPQFVTDNPEPPPGDADQDLDVDFVDYQIFIDSLGQMHDAGPINGDFNNDGVNDGFDFAIWQHHFGTNLNPAEPTAANPVPTPTTLTIFSIFALTLRRKPHRQP